MRSIPAVTGQKFMVTSNSQNTQKKLSIQVSLNGLSFCILDESSKSVVFSKKLDFEKQLDPIKLLSKIELEYENESRLSQPVDDVKVIFSNALFTLVPEELFSEEQASSFLKFNAKILKTDFVAFDKLSEGIVNVYIPYANITNYFFDKYGEFEYQHSMSVLIETFLQQEQGTAKAFLHCQPNHFELVIIEKGKLLFANSFEYETSEDFLYYLLFTAEQLGLDPEDFELVLCGNISKDAEAYKLAWNYIKNISFAGPLHNFTFDTSKEQNEQAGFLLLNSF
ncbi:MAG: DUF3822 family protein [Bacteroidota bacterium]|nr:DUF3822 family protein [Bacteroidota bacterium]